MRSHAPTQSASSTSSIFNGDSTTACWNQIVPVCLCLCLIPVLGVYVRVSPHTFACSVVFATGLAHAAETILQCHVAHSLSFRKDKLCLEPDEGTSTAVTLIISLATSEGGAWARVRESWRKQRHGFAEEGLSSQCFVIAVSDGGCYLSGWVLSSSNVTDDNLDNSDLSCQRMAKAVRLPKGEAITCLTRFPLVGQEHPQPVFFSGHEDGKVREWIVRHNSDDPNSWYIEQKNTIETDGVGSVTLVTCTLPRHLAMIKSTAPDCLQASIIACALARAIVTCAHQHPHPHPHPHPHRTC